MNCLELRERVACGEAADATHEEGCPACRQWTDVLEEAMRAVEQPEVEPAPGDWDRLSAAIARRERRAAQVSLRCTYCHDDLNTRGEGEAVYCAACLAPHHLDCFRSNAGCGTPACHGVSTVKPELQVQAGGKPWGGPKATPAPERTRRRPKLRVWLAAAGLIGGGIAALSLLARPSTPLPPPGPSKGAKLDEPKHSPDPTAEPETEPQPAMWKGGHLGATGSTYALVLAEGYTDEDAKEVVRWLQNSPESPVADRKGLRVLATRRMRQLYDAGGGLEHGLIAQVRIGGFEAPDALTQAAVRQLDQGWKPSPARAHWVREMNPNAIGAAALVCLTEWLDGYRKELSLHALRDAMEDMTRPVPWGEHADSPQGRAFRVTQDHHDLLRNLGVQPLHFIHRIGGNFVPDSMSEAKAFFADLKLKAAEGPLLVEMWDPSQKRATRSYVRWH